MRRRSRRGVLRGVCVSEGRKKEERRKRDLRLSLSLWRKAGVLAIVRRATVLAMKPGRAILVARRKDIVRF